MSGRNILGVVLSLLGAIMGLLLTPYFFMLQYADLMGAEAALGGSGLGCALVVEFIFPVISDLGMIGGALYLVAGISFMSGDKHAFKIAVVANVLALQAAFWPIIPLIVTSMTPWFAINFLGNLVIFFLLLLSVGRISGKVTLMALLTGMAWVLAFMNGVAATNRIVYLTGLGDPLSILYTTMQRVNWVASLAWGVTTVAIVLSPKEWVRKLGLGSAILAIVAGYPSGLISPFGGGFSMFLLGPMLSTLLLILFISPKLWEKLVISRKE